MRRLALLLVTLAAPALADMPDTTAWPPLERRFESTGGGGWIIDGYDPVLRDGHCVTDFSVTSPQGETFFNEARFAVRPIPGGVLCVAGTWRAKDGLGSGTTPLEVFIRADGARFRSP
jgi:hypothetical protein